MLRDRAEKREASIAEADRGDFISQAMDAWVSSWDTET